MIENPRETVPFRAKELSTGFQTRSVGRMSPEASDYSGRLVKLVIVTPDGKLLGSLAPFSVSSPWWQEVGAVVRGALENHGLQVTVLRLLEADRPRPHGGSVTYLAEVETRVPEAVGWSAR